MSESDRTLNFDTLSIHAGCGSDPTTGARTIPIHQTSAYSFPNIEDAADIFHLRKAGYVYSRLTNPTVSALEEKLAALDGGVGATCTSSGISAQMLMFFTLLSHGDHFVAASKLYGGTLAQLRYQFKRAFNWEGTFVDPTDPNNFKRAITDKTKVIFVESPTNPENVIVDYEAIAKIAEEHNIVFAVDNTIGTPALCRPLDYGAHLVSYSTTKYLSGHGNAMGGAIVDGGNFNWKKEPEKYPTLAMPEPAYDNAVFADMFGEKAFCMHNHAVGLRDLGMNQQPLNAYLTVMGLETLGLRMEKHSKNAQQVAEFLTNHAGVDWVSYAGLPSHVSYKNGQKYMKDGKCSAVMTFGIKGGYDAAVDMVNNVKLFSHLANIGDTRSLLIHPASTTHSQLTDEQKTAAGTRPETIRLSIGIEDVRDIIADLDQALNYAMSQHKACA
jgi:O-acetylhomoserine (thiol)-lyase